MRSDEYYGQPRLYCHFDGYLDTMGPILAPSATRWDEDATPFREMLYLDAASYTVNRLFDPPEPSSRFHPKYVVSPQGTFAYMNAVLPRGESLDLYRPRPGTVTWNGDVVLPMLVDMHINAHKGRRFEDNVPEVDRVVWGTVWMSLTPAEMISQRSGIRKATGKVVIGGLGLGWFLRKVCEKDSVEEVIVVEKSQELLDWYGYDVCKRYPKVKDVICNSIYNEISRHGNSTQFLLDIWPVYAGASQDRRLRAARRVLGKRLWAWGMD